MTKRTMLSNIQSGLIEILESNADGVSFLPLNSRLDLGLNGFVFKTKHKRSSYVKGNLGHFYHVLIYKPDSRGRIPEVDLFDAVLIDPSVYILNLIKCGFFGIVAKKTKFSDKFMKSLKELVIKGEQT